MSDKELQFSNLCKIKKIQESKIDKQNKEIKQLKQQLEAVHYYANAYCLYQLEKNWNVKREDIEEVKYSGGHGYTAATVHFKDGTSIIESDETLAGLLLAWYDFKSGENK